MTLQAFVRKMSPSAYKMAVRLRHGGVTARMMHMPSRLRARRLFRTGVDLTVVIGGRIGLSGVLTNAGNALAAGQAYGIDLDLRFTSPTYARPGTTRIPIGLMITSSDIGPLRPGKQSVMFGIFRMRGSRLHSMKRLNWYGAT